MKSDCNVLQAACLFSIPFGALFIVRIMDNSRRRYRVELWGGC